VQPGEVFEVESVEGYSGYFRSPGDFTPESYALAEAVKWAVVGPITVAGAVAGSAVAVTIHDVAITTPGVVTYGAYSRDVDPYDWWDDESGADAYPIEDGLVRFDEHTRLPTRPLIGCLAVRLSAAGKLVLARGRRAVLVDGREIRARRPRNQEMKGEDQVRALVSAADFQGGKPRAQVVVLPFLEGVAVV